MTVFEKFESDLKHYGFEAEQNESVIEIYQHGELVVRVFLDDGVTWRELPFLRLRLSLQKKLDQLIGRLFGGAYEEHQAVTRF